MKTYFFVLIALFLAAAGCSKVQAPKQAAEISSDSLSVGSADTVLAAQPAQGQEAQKQAEAPVTDIVVNKEAAPLVEAPVALAPSSESPDPKTIQQALKNCGLYTGDIDGKLGPKTKEAVREFQQRHNLEVDGKVGPKTWALLNSSLESSQR